MTAPTRRIAIVTPILDDWECLAILAEALHGHLVPHGWEPIIVAVDDGSRPTPAAHAATGASVVLRLSRNVGHQRAIAIGLDYVLREVDADVIATMDADGEDRPEDLLPLLAALDEEPNRIVVASRGRRSESWQFVASYYVYKATFRLLTGEYLDFGNYSVMGRPAARRLTAMHELWLSLPGTVVRARLDLVRLSTDRGRRYVGRSRMKVVGLVVHGMSAVGVFVERAFTRVLMAIGILAGLIAVGFVAALMLKALGLATPGWVTTIAAALVVVLVQTAMIALCGLLLVFGNAANVALAPATTARDLIAGVDRITGGPSAEREAQARSIKVGPVAIATGPQV